MNLHAILVNIQSINVNLESTKRQKTIESKDNVGKSEKLGYNKKTDFMNEYTNTKVNKKLAKNKSNDKNFQEIIKLENKISEKKIDNEKNDDNPKSSKLKKENSIELIYTENDENKPIIINNKNHKDNKNNDFLKDLKRNDSNNQEKKSKSKNTPNIPRYDENKINKNTSFERMQASKKKKIKNEK